MICNNAGEFIKKYSTSRYILINLPIPAIKIMIHFYFAHIDFFISFNIYFDISKDKLINVLLA